jgi:ERCC4-type nuclease
MITSILINSDEPKDIQEINFGVPSVVTSLNADAVVGCKDGATLAIERKTPSDLLGSIRDGRLFNQCHALREISEWSYLVIHGRMTWVDDGKVRTDGYRVTNWDWHSLFGSLLTVQEMGVGVFHATDYAEAIRILASRDRSDITIHPRRASEPMSKDEAFLASLPGIGAMRAKEALATFGTAAHFLDWCTNIWDDYGMKLRGVGRNQKVKIRSVLGLTDRNYLTQNPWEDEKNEPR